MAGEFVDHYATLGLKPTATPGQIKQAYRDHAKRAHPDAGGSAAAMQRVNEAHRVLSDPSERRKYDFLREHPTEQTPHLSQGAASHSEHLYDAGQFNRRRRSQARALAWQLLQRSILAAILLGIITRFFFTQTTDKQAKLFLAIIGFAPVYGVLLGVIFLLSPQIRLDLHDFIHHKTHPKSPDPHLSPAELTTLAALALAFIPLALAWVLLLAPK